MLREFIRAALIVGALPVTLTNGTTADATQVMADLNWLVNQVNANAAPLATTALTNANNNFTVAQSGIAASAAANFPIASQVQNRVFSTLSSTLGTNSITARISALPLTAYVVGQVFTFQPAQTNTTGVVTIAIDSAGTVPVSKYGLGSLVASDMVAGRTALIVARDTGKLELLNPQTPAPLRAGAVASGYNISAGRQAASGTKIDISAPQILLQDASGNSFTANSVNVTIDFTTNGANGLDTGALAASTFYYGYVIAKADGTIAGVGSINPASSGPSMPSGYIYKAMVTCGKTDSGSNFLQFRQAGNIMYYAAGQNVLSAGAATIEASVGLGSVVPTGGAVAVGLWGSCLVTGNAGAGQNTAKIRWFSGVEYLNLHAYADVAGQNGQDTATFEIPVTALNTLVYYLNVPGGAPSAATLDLQVQYYKLPGGGQ